MDSFGASETGANGSVDVTDKGPRFRMNEWTTVITDAGKPGTGRRGRPAGAARTRAGRLLQGRGEDRGDVRRVRRRALGDPRRPRGDRGRRHHHRARARLAVHQHGRREGVPRRGRGGAEESSERLRRDRRRRARRPLRRSGRGRGRAARGHDADARRPRTRTLEARSPATSCRSTSCSSTRSPAHPPASPNYRWAKELATSE